MLVFLDKKLVVLANPKTATSAVERAITQAASIVISKPPKFKHASIKEFGKYLTPFIPEGELSKFDTTALIREPLDWLGSWYRFRHRENAKKKGKSTSEVSFDDFALAACQPEPPDFARIKNQADFLAPRENLRVKHIFLYEDMDRFVAFLTERIGRKIELDKVNVSVVTTELRLSKPVEEKFREKFAADFALHAAIGKLTRG